MWAELVLYVKCIWSKLCKYLVYQKHTYLIMEIMQQCSIPNTQQVIRMETLPHINPGLFSVVVTCASILFYQCIKFCVLLIFM